MVTDENYYGRGAYYVPAAILSSLSASTTLVFTINL